MSIGPTPQRYWDWRALANFAFGGAGSGLIVVSIVVFGLGAPAATATGVGALLISLGLGGVFLKLGRRWRFLNVFRNPATSWMSREAYVAVLLVPAGGLCFVYQSMWLFVCTAVLAATFLYAQARILKACRGIPAWRVEAITALILTSGFAEGAGLLLVLGAAAGWPIPTVLTMLALVALAARALAWTIYRRTLHVTAPETTLRLLDQINAAFLLIGHALPAVALAVGWAAELGLTITAVLAGVLITISGWLCKFQLVNRAALNQGYAIVHSPARGGGSAGPGASPGWKLPRP